MNTVSISVVCIVEQYEDNTKLIDKPGGPRVNHLPLPPT